MAAHIAYTLFYMPYFTHTRQYRVDKQYLPQKKTDMQLPLDKEADDIYLDDMLMLRHLTLTLANEIGMFPHMLKTPAQTEAFPWRQHHDTVLSSLKKELVIVRIL